MARVLVVGGVSSGVGKTTVTLGLLEALRRRDLAVQAFKVGPDFIDPGFHELVTGRPSYNLDGWMCGRQHALETVWRHAADADVAVVEGVMGCFDGVDGTSEDGSTAQIAKWLDAPVLLVIDASGQARSAAAVALGFERFDPDLHVGGVIANRVGGETHARWIREAIAASCRAVTVGAVPRDAAVALPERHLGLVTAAEGPLTPGMRERLAQLVERSVDLDRLLAIASPIDGPTALGVPVHRGSMSGAAAGARSTRGQPLTSRGDEPLVRLSGVRIGVARDAAFQFYYAENLDRLRAAGAEIVFWSPLDDVELPDVQGLYIGGGYPELHAARLAANRGVLDGVRRFGEAGRPIYAECGGLMYLADALEDLDGGTHRMAGVLPSTVRMRPRRLTLAYSEVVLTGDSPIGHAGATARGHEFHYSSLDPVPASVSRVYGVSRRRGGEQAEGYLVGRTLMSYVHLHFASSPELASWFVRACAAA